MNGRDELFLLLRKYSQKSCGRIWNLKFGDFWTWGALVCLGNVGPSPLARMPHRVRFVSRGQHFTISPFRHDSFTTSSWHSRETNGIGIVPNAGAEISLLILAKLLLLYVLPLFVVTFLVLFLSCFFTLPPSHLAPFFHCSSNLLTNLLEAILRFQSAEALQREAR